MNSQVVGFFGSLALVLCSVTAVAAEQPLRAELTVRKVIVQADGKEKLVATDVAKPGDLLEYQVTYRNVGEKPAKNIAGTLPAPHNVAYIKDSVSPANAVASIDGARFSAMPLMRKVPDATGQYRLEEVPESEYRYLRWNLGDLQPGQSKTISARMRIN